MHSLYGKYFCSTEKKERFGKFWVNPNYSEIVCLLGHIPPLTPVDVRIGGRSFGGVGFVELPRTSSPARRSDTSYSVKSLTIIVLIKKSKCNKTKIIKVTSQRIKGNLNINQIKY